MHVVISKVESPRTRSRQQGHDQREDLAVHDTYKNGRFYIYIKKWSPTHIRAISVMTFTEREVCVDGIGDAVTVRHSPAGYGAWLDFHYLELSTLHNTNAQIGTR